MHYVATSSAAARTLPVGAAGRQLCVAPWEGFAAQLLGAQLRRRAAAPLAARLLHAAPPDRDPSQQQHGRGDSTDVPLRDIHSSALAAARDDASAPPREVRGVATRVRRGACFAPVSRPLTP